MSVSYPQPVRAWTPPLDHEERLAAIGRAKVATAYDEYCTTRFALRPALYFGVSSVAIAVGNASERMPA